MNEVYITEEEKQPLRDLIAYARENNLCLHCFYQDIWFTPDELEACHAGGTFRWWKIENQWEIAKLRNNARTYGGKTVWELYGEEPDTLEYWKGKAKRLEAELDLMRQRSNDKKTE